MTHVLINIKDIESDIEKLEQSYAFNREDQAINDYRIRFLQNLLRSNKQISLDKKNIEEKAEEIAMTSFKLVLTPIETYKEILHQRLGFKLGYKQALLDLLK